MTALNKQAIDFSQPLETESGEPVKYICHDVIEYKCSRVCVDIATGVVYSSPYVGLKIRNKEANPRAKLREQIESAADAYCQFDNGLISDMKCGDLSHEYLLFVKEPKNVLALLDELEAAEHTAAVDHEAACSLVEENEEVKRKLEAAEKRIAELSASHSKLRDAMAAIHNTIRMDGGYTPLAAILNAAKCAHEESATAAGIGVKGE